MTSRELRQQAKQLTSQARQLHESVAAEGRTFSDEDEANYRKYIADSRAAMDAAVALEGGAARLSELDALDTDLDATLEDVPAADGAGGDDTDLIEGRADGGGGLSRAEMAYRCYALTLLHGSAERREGQLGHRWPTSQIEEFRALQADLDVSGGYTVEPAQFIRRLIKAVDDLTFMRSLATRIPLASSDKIEGVSLDNDPEDSTWTSEIGDPDEDTAMGFGGRALEPNKLSKLLKVSDKLLAVSSLGMEALIRDRLAYKQAVTQEKHFLTGNGAGQPLGVFTASANGISTGRDVATDNTTTSVTFDGLKSARGTLKQQYRGDATWIAHRDLETQVSKLKDGNGQYIWQQSVIPGDPDRMLGFPLRLSEFAPNTFTTGQYVALLGVLSNYWFADIESLAGIDRLVEKYYPRVGFVSKSWVDGMPVLEEAFVRVTLA